MCHPAKGCREALGSYYVIGCRNYVSTAVSLLQHLHLVLADICNGGHRDADGYRVGLGEAGETMVVERATAQRAGGDGGCRGNIEVDGRVDVAGSVVAGALASGPGGGVGGVGVDAAAVTVIASAAKFIAGAACEGGGTALTVCQR